MNESDGPIVAAVREDRAAIVAACDYDLRRLAERLRRIEHQHATQIVSPRANITSQSGSHRSHNGSD